MTNSERPNYTKLAALKEPSQLKIDINRGIASLSGASESWFQPHLCLNGPEGIQVIGNIARDPDQADTAISITENVIYGGGSDIWLNVKFVVFMGEMSSKSMLILTPRQTSYIITNLPDESRTIVLQKVKTWYLEHLRREMDKALDKVAKQIADGVMLIEGTNDNRVFDIHDKSGHDNVEYTEWDIIGSELFLKFFIGHTLFHSGQDGYERIDQMLMKMEEERKSALDGFISVARTLS